MKDKLLRFIKNCNNKPVKRYRVYFVYNENGEEYPGWDCFETCEEADRFASNLLINSEPEYYFSHVKVIRR